ncbi:MAG: methylated-DNA--[protein]-cysteine S-methyltransferase [Fuerstiella sp.]|nr:methylated-DNA--[protein]-cysteine S-methyltransferase [Fuerstiella sp.]
MTETARNVIHYRFVDESPVGRLLLAADSCGLRYLLFAGGRELSRYPLPPESDRTGNGDIWQTDTGQLDDTMVQLNAYFSGELMKFDLPLAPHGTSFQKKVWSALTEIPWGQTITYGELACRIGQPTASRAVGLANGRNPISIIIPCHRVIGKTGQLVGYGGGLNLKKVLLQLEDSLPATQHQGPDGCHDGILISPRGPSGTKMGVR